MYDDDDDYDDVITIMIKEISQKGSYPQEKRKSYKPAAIDSVKWSILNELKQSEVI